MVLYAIFVDSKYTKPWSDYDMNSTIDSIHAAINWLELRAAEDSIELNITLEVHRGINGKTPIKKDFPKKTLSATIFGQDSRKGDLDLSKWADRIAVIAGRSLPKENSNSTSTKGAVKNRERLIARLRDLHRTDAVALMYFVNNYFQNEASIALKTHSNDEVEFSIVSYKEPSTIAHEFLHLFGAEDFYVSPLDVKRREKKRKSRLNAMFPDEVMTNKTRTLDSMMISEFTRYLIGWDKELDQKYWKLAERKSTFRMN